MRRIVTLLVAAALAASLSPVRAGTPAAGPQKETGTVLLPGPGPNGEVTAGCWTGWARRAWIFSGGTQSGPFGSMIPIDKKTWGGRFKLAVTGGLTGAEDLDVTFYIEPGVVDPVNDPAQQGGIVESASYTTRKAGGETGVVPKGTKVALVCLGIGSGANAGWSYTATPPKKR